MHSKAHDSDERAGTVLGDRYRLERVLGRGGMGIVYEALDLQLDRTVALKRLVVLDGVTSRATVAERLEREARATARLGHANIVPVIDLGRADDGMPYIVMQLLDGITLADHLAARGMLAEGEAVDLHVQVLDGLQAAHERGILHRDIKPANLFMTRAGSGWLLRILDFGVAYLLEDGAKKLTATGIAVGTPAYMSPERFRGAPPTVHGDVYSVAVCLYEALTGSLPFQAESAMALQGRVLLVDAPDPRTLRPDLRPALAELIQRGLAKDPEARFASAREMRDALLAILTGEDTSEPALPRRAISEESAALRDISMANTLPAGMKAPPAPTPALGGHDPASVTSVPSIAAVPARVPAPEPRPTQTGTVITRSLRAMLVGLLVGTGLAAGAVAFWLWQQPPEPTAEPLPASSPAREAPPRIRTPATPTPVAEPTALDEAPEVPLGIDAPAPPVEPLVRARPPEREPRHPRPAREPRPTAPVPTAPNAPAELLAPAGW